MRTLRGYEAIECAERFNVALYDLDYQGEVTVEQAKQFIESRRDPKSFVIENWPDTDTEAEQIVWDKFHMALMVEHWSDTRIVDIAANTESGMPIHLRAAELAAQRLAEQDKLEIVETNKDYNLYRIPRTVYLTDQFLDELSGVVCDECADLNVEGPFHQSCLMALIDVLSKGSFTFVDITEVRQTQHSDSKTKLIRPGIGIQWLSRKASATKSRWQAVLRPMFAREGEAKGAGEEVQLEEQSQPAAENLRQSSEESSHTSAMIETDTIERTKITKDQLIRYLRSVEILDENGELTRLQTERVGLIKQITLKEREIERIEKQRAFLEKQCQEMQRDMDTLIQAMQIAKRRGQSTAPVIDATFDIEHRS